VVTIVTTPKSAGVSSRAKMTVLITWAARDSPEADIVAAAPRTARRRKSWLSALGQNAPLASKGIIPCLIMSLVKRVANGLGRNKIVDSPSKFRFCHKHGFPNRSQRLIFRLRTFRSPKSHRSARYNAGRRVTRCQVDMEWFL
jgi:hypothetical protein